MHPELGVLLADVSLNISEHERSTASWAIHGSLLQIIIAGRADIYWQEDFGCSAVGLTCVRPGRRGTFSAEMVRTVKLVKELWDNAALRTRGELVWVIMVKRGQEAAGWEAQFDDADEFGPLW